jgi:pyrimidine-specific ribonucleoside hydrolase
LNDGLQVSTGATLGHGLISVKSGMPAIPAADFTYAGVTVSIALKANIAKEIEGLLKETFKSSGGLTTEYWLKVRELALLYWLKYDRHEIFDVAQTEEPTRTH